MIKFTCSFFFRSIFIGDAFFYLYFLVTSNTRIFGQSEQLHRNTDDALKEHNANNSFFFSFGGIRNFRRLHMLKKTEHFSHGPDRDADRKRENEKNTVNDS